MTQFVIDNAAPPARAPTLRDRIASLQPGETLLAAGTTLGTVRVAISQMKASKHWPGLRKRTFTTWMSPEGPRARRDT